MVGCEAGGTVVWNSNFIQVYRRAVALSAIPFFFPSAVHRSRDPRLCSNYFPTLGRACFYKFRVDISSDGADCLQLRLRIIWVEAKLPYRVCTGAPSVVYLFAWGRHDQQQCRFCQPGAVYYGCSIARTARLLGLYTEARVVRSARGWRWWIVAWRRAGHAGSSCCSGPTQATTGASCSWP